MTNCKVSSHAQGITVSTQHLKAEPPIRGPELFTNLRTTYLHISFFFSIFSCFFMSLSSSLANFLRFAPMSFSPAFTFFFLPLISSFFPSRVRWHALAFCGFLLAASFCSFAFPSVMMAETREKSFHKHIINIA